MLTDMHKLQQYIRVDEKPAFFNFTEALYGHISGKLHCGYKSIVFLCIGTDRLTGDSLGPLIGYKLGDLKYKNVYVYGNLDNPVHAKNLDEITKTIDLCCEKPLVVAIDACLGKMENVGCVTIGDGPVKPGAAVGKIIKPVGDIHITGIVNFGGWMDLLVLQNTRLCMVMKMADLISMGIRYILWKLRPEKDIIRHFSSCEL